MTNRKATSEKKPTVENRKNTSGKTVANKKVKSHPKKKSPANSQEKRPGSKRETSTEKKQFRSMYSPDHQTIQYHAYLLAEADNFIQHPDVYWFQAKMRLAKRR